jgi:hypothetical protein
LNYVSSSFEIGSKDQLISEHCKKSITSLNFMCYAFKCKLLVNVFRELKLNLRTTQLISSRRQRYFKCSKKLLKLILFSAAHFQISFNPSIFFCMFCIIILILQTFFVTCYKLQGMGENTDFCWAPKKDFKTCRQLKQSQKYCRVEKVTFTAARIRMPKY